MATGNEILTTVRRYIADLEERVEQQRTLIETLAQSGRDSIQAMQTLRALTATLALTRQHLEFQTSIEARKRSAGVAATTTA